MSAPSSGALLHGRACGAATESPAGDGRVGPASPALTADMDDIEEPATPEPSAGRQASAAVRPVSGSATASAQNNGSVTVPGHKSARGRGVVAERHPVGLHRRSARSR